MTAAVYIKNIIPEKMKVKLALIDSYFPASAVPAQFEYFTDTAHIDRWVYSPENSSRIIETVFGDEI